MTQTLRLGRLTSFTFVLAGLWLCGNLRPASADAKRDITYKITSFYKWYVRQSKLNGVPAEDVTMMRKYCSRRLYRWIYSKAYNDFGADYFLSAQDFGEDWDKARVSNLRIGSRTATLQVTLGTPKKNEREMGQRTLDLNLVKESGLWKINRVNGE